MNPNDSILTVSDLVASNGGGLVLDHVSFNVRRGDSVAILGPSGCGKTTLLRHIIGLERPAQGSIEMLGHSIVSSTHEELRECLLQVGVLFQGGALLGSLTVGENVALPLREHRRDLDEEKIQLLVRRRLSQVSLAGKEYSFPCQLSGGEAKRAALARALALGPKLLLLDEPSAGLDPITAADLDNLILYLRDELRVTIVVVTHELASVAVIANRVLILNDGRIAAQGTLQQLKENPDPWVQQFLGRKANGHRQPPTAPDGVVDLDTRR